VSNLKVGNINRFEANLSKDVVSNKYSGRFFAALNERLAKQYDCAVKDVVSNKFPIWLVRFGRTASLQIAYVAWPHRAICA